MGLLREKQRLQGTAPDLPCAPWPRPGPLLALENIFPRRLQRRPNGSRERRDRVFVNHFWQLKDVAGEFWMNDAAIMQQTQLAELLWLVTLQSRKRGSHRLGSD